MQEINQRMQKKIPAAILYGLPLILAAGLKCMVWSPDITPFNADEAIIALMARHINQGSMPAFFYGQYYMGSLDAILVALGFMIFGEFVWVIRLIQSILYLGTVATTGLIGARVLNHPRAALYAGILAAIPTVNIVLYSTVSLGGYGEMLLIGNLLLLGGMSLIEEMGNAQNFNGKLKIGLAIWGFGAGFVFWVLGLSLVYSLPILIFIFLYLIKHHKASLLTGLIFLSAGGILGSIPWWGSALLEGGWAVIIELAGGAIAGASTDSWIAQFLRRISSLIVFGGSAMTGIRPPWTFQWLMLPLIPFVLIFWLAVLVYIIKRLIDKELDFKLVLIFLIGVVLSVGFILTPYGDDPSGRYFLPFLLPMSIFGTELILNKTGGRLSWEVGLLSFLIFFNAGGIIQSIRSNPPGLTTQFDSITQVDHSQMGELIEFLYEHDIKTGYSNYWVSYPLAFLSNEEIIFVPRLPYHEDFRYTSRDDRYPAYTEIVQSSDKVAYITTLHPDLNRYLESSFENLENGWNQETIGDYTVYYGFTFPVHVSEIGLGETTGP
jgi:4-amino-4-deoxy-L-arabinose transferase-like glycosyltransferase